MIFKLVQLAKAHPEFYDNSVYIARNPFKAVGDVLVLAGDTLPLIAPDTSDMQLI